MSNAVIDLGRVLAVVYQVDRRVRKVPEAKVVEKTDSQTYLLFTDSEISDTYN